MQLLNINMSDGGRFVFLYFDEEVKPMPEHERAHKIWATNTSPHNIERVKQWLIARGLNSAAHFKRLDSFKNIISVDMPPEGSKSRKLLFEGEEIDGSD